MPSFSPRPPFSKLPHLLRKLALGAAFSMTGLMAADLSSVRNLYVDWSLRPDPRSAAAFDLSVLHPQAELDMEPGHALGSHYLAFLDTVRFQTGTRASMLAADRQMASKPSATEKRGRLADPAHPQWIPWVVESLVDPAAKKGFDGFVLSLGGDQCARELVLRKLGLRRDQDQHLIEVGGKRLGPDFILAVEQVASWFKFLDGPLVLRGLPSHPVADHSLAFLPAGMADDAPAVRGFHYAVAAVSGHDETGFQ